MKHISLSILLILMLSLTACGAASNANQQTASDPLDGSLPVQLEILVGTFKLEGTDQALTSQEVTQLLPLWQVYRDLSSSDTAAQEEIDALVQQIQDTMTPEQMKAITDMHLTRQDMFTVMQDQGITQGRGQSQDSGSRPGGQNGNGEGFVPPEGGPPGGFGGDGSGGFQGSGPGGQTFTPDQIATAQAARGQGGGFNRIPSGLFDALIQLLQTKASS
jgi:hypothetical protein